MHALTTARRLTIAWIAGVCVAALYLCPAWPSAQATPKRVLLLHSAGVDGPLRRSLDTNLEAALRADRPLDVELFPESLDDDRLDSSRHQGQMKDYLREKYRDQQIDVLIAVFDPAVVFLRKFREELFRGVPIVYVKTGPYDTADEASDMTGVSTGALFGDAIDLTLALHPSADQLIVVDGALQNTGTVESAIRQQFQKWSSRATLTYLRDRSLPDVLNEVRSAQTSAVVLFVRQLLRAPKVSLSQQAGLQEVLRVSPVPVYVATEPLIGTGAVGGHVARTRAIADAVAEMALQIAHGAKVREVRPVTMSGVPTFDWRALRQWQIPQSRLPSDSVILFRPPTVWSEYRHYAVGALAIIAGQLTLIAGLLVQRRRRQAAESALQISEARTGAILKAVPDLMFVIDRDGTYIDFHARDPAELYLPPEQFVGKRMRDVLPAELASLFESSVREALTAAEPVSIEYSLPINGAERRFESRLVRCGNAAVVSIVRDVTAKYEAASELRQAHAEITRVTRMHSLGQLAASVVHEVSQPATAIVANARAGLRQLESCPADRDMCREVLQEIAEDGKRVGDVVSRIRALAKQAPFSPARVSANDIIDDVLTLSAHFLGERRFSAHVDRAENLPDVSGDRVQLQQVLLNLVTNASDAMHSAPPGLRVLTIRSARSDHYVTIAVKDSGSGLGNGDRDRIFRPFFTTKVEGMGMGLAIGRSIMEAHGGYLKVVDSGQQGSTFEFGLPIDESM